MGHPIFELSSGGFAGLSDGDLTRLLFTEGDQLPMEFAREVSSRGQGMVPRLSEVVSDPRNWSRTDAGWCAVVHATYLLGAIGGEAAIGPLMDCLRFGEEREQDLVTRELPSIFGSLGPKALELLRPVAAALGGDWMLRLPDVSHYRRDWLRFYAPLELRERRRRREDGRLTEAQAWREALSSPWGADPGLRLHLAGEPRDGSLKFANAMEGALARLDGMKPCGFAGQPRGTPGEPRGAAGESRKTGTTRTKKRLLREQWGGLSIRTINLVRKLFHVKTLEGLRAASPSADELFGRKGVGRKTVEDLAKVLPLRLDERRPAAAAPMPPRSGVPGDPWLAKERRTFHVSRKLAAMEFGSAEERARYERDLVGHVRPPPPASPWEAAQDIMYEARQEKDPGRRMAMARRALEACPDNSDALVILADQAAGQAERRRLYELAAAAGRRVLGERFFEERSGRFWDFVEARAYMRARVALADELLRSADYAAAADHYREVIRLDPRDPMRCGLTLLAALGAAGRFEEAGMLLDSLEHSCGRCVEWPWMRALAAFARAGASPEADRLLRLAVGRNRFLPALLLGLEDMPDRLPNDVSRGTREEAWLCAPAISISWERVRGALRWLAGIAGETPASGD